jgi:hypothetical protein
MESILTSFWPQTGDGCWIADRNILLVNTPSTETGQTCNILLHYFHELKINIGLCVLIDQVVTVPGMECTYVSGKEAHMFVYYIDRIISD